MHRVGTAILSALAVLALLTPCRGENPASLAPTPAATWIPYALSHEPPSSYRAPAGSGPLERLVDDFFAELVSTVAASPGRYFTLAVPELEDPSGEIAGKAHLKNLLLLRLIETGRFKIVGPTAPGSTPAKPGSRTSPAGSGSSGTAAAPEEGIPDFTLGVSVERTPRWVCLSGRLSARDRPGLDRILLAAVDRDESVDALLEGGGAQSLGHGFELVKLGSADVGPVLDADAADLTGKGRDNLVLLTAGSVAILELQTNEVDHVRSFDFPPVPRAERPPRGIRGTLAAFPASGERPARVLATTSQLERPVEWNVAASQPRTVLFGSAFPLAAGRSPGTVLAGKIWPGRNYFDSSLVSAETSSQSQGPTFPLPFPFYALKRGTGAAADGVGVLDTEWTLHLLTGDLSREIGRIERCGSAFAILNAHEDGSWEVAASAPGVPGSAEKLSVYRVSPAGARLLWRTEGAPGAICAMAAGDFVEAGKSEAVAIGCGEKPDIFLIRRVAEEAP